MKNNSKAALRKDDQKMGGKAIPQSRALTIKNDAYIYSIAKEESKRDIYGTFLGNGYITLDLSGTDKCPSNFMSELFLPEKCTVHFTNDLFGTEKCFSNFTSDLSLPEKCTAYIMSDLSLPEKCSLYIMSDLFGPEIFIKFDTNKNL